MKLEEVLKARSGATASKPRGFQRQKVLQPLQGVERQESGDGKDDHRDRVAEPVLLPRRVDARQPVEGALDRPEHGRQKVSFAVAGCIWPGGVGAGLYGFLVVAIIAVFVAGLMVGRTPEYLGKKIEVREMKFAMLAVLIYPLSVLGFTGASVLLQTALDKAKR